MIATGFNRCHVSTSEGGSIEEEVYVRNIVDQVDTNGTVFLGLTTGCARCHDHKYDPIRAKDYYQLFAFFNNIDGPALDGNSAQVGADRPGADAASRPRRSGPIDAEIAGLASKTIAAEPTRRSPPTTKVDSEMHDETTAARRSEFVWIDDALPAGAIAAGRRPVGIRRQARPPGLQRRPALRNKAQGLKQRFFDNAARKLGSARATRCLPTSTSTPQNPPKEMMLQWHTNGQLDRTGPTGART